MVLQLQNIKVGYLTGDLRNIGFKQYLLQRIKGSYHVDKFMAVDGVSFELEEGDLLGIIGSNGAGKSTLLKVIAGIMKPQEGTMEVNGSIAALLELASGFDLELTVRENTYLRGALLGYTRDFMKEKYQSIIEFAELTEFQDRAFKHLSSGMKSRLAFSIASLVDPDILILDEVLAVGDAAFQQKSEEKMMEIIHRGKSTILISHSTEQIRRLCNKVLWMERGKQIDFGEANRICDAYEKYWELKTQED